MRHLTPDIDPALLVGFDTGDDAAVWKLDERNALVFTADFFTPIVDDAGDWGRIAAANALSDVYAMGGRPILCLNIAGWPREGLPLDLLGEVLRGGAEVAHSAGAAVVGGHTIDDPEPKYGMAVVGLVDPKKVMTNAGAQPSDVLVLTKPIGLGVIATAIKNEVAPPEVVARAIEVMTTLNRDAAEAMVVARASAATDVTGFGLLGHLQKMLAASGVAAEIRAGDVPVIEGAHFLAGSGQVAGGSKRNREWLKAAVRFKAAVDEIDRVLLTDAQTSGGMLISIGKRRLARLRRELEDRAIPCVVVGSITDEEPGTVVVHP